MKTLNRRHFLQTIGLASATAALSPHWLGRAFTVRAQQPAGMMGRVVQIPVNGVTLHTYIAPEGSAVVTSHIIETANSLVLVDTQFVQTFANELKAYVDSLGKPLDRVILSHEHPDHFMGANVFAEAPFLATPTVAANVTASIEAGIVQNLAGLIGENEVPAAARAPEGTLEAGDMTVDGVTFGLDIYTNTEAPETLVLRLPEQGVVVLQDLLYNNVHFFPGLDRANWIATLNTLRASLADYQVLLPGHGMPTSRGELDLAIEYLTFANETAASAASADEIIAALQTGYPSFGGLGLLGFWAQFFQPA